MSQPKQSHKSVFSVESSKIASNFGLLETPIFRKLMSHLSSADKKECISLSFRDCFMRAKLFSLMSLKLKTHLSTEMSFNGLTTMFTLKASDLWVFSINYLSSKDFHGLLISIESVFSIFHHLSLIWDICINAVIFVRK